MAELPNQQQNFISDLMNWSQEQLSVLDGADDLASRWNNNEFSTAMVDADITAKFPHLTKAKVIAAMTALEAVRTALGDDSSGPKVNLVKMKG